MTVLQHEKMVASFTQNDKLLGSYTQTDKILATINSADSTLTGEITAAEVVEVSEPVDIDELSPFTLSNTGNSLLARLTAIDCSKGNFLPTGNSYQNLFSGMTALTSITNLSIPSNVTNIQSMFWQAYFTSAPMDWNDLAGQVSHINNIGSAFARMFKEQYTDVVMRDFDWANATKMASILYDNSETTLDVSGWKFPKLTSPPGIYWNRNLTTLTIDGWDFSNMTSFGNRWLAQDWKLSSIRGTFTGLGNKMSTVSFAELKYNANNPHVGFDTETVPRIIDALVTKTDGGAYSLVFSTNTEANVTEEQIAQATEKGWTISYSG